MKCDYLNRWNLSDCVGELLQVQHFLGKLIAKDISIALYPKLNSLPATIDVAG